ncbi:MAG: hypothetical protein AB8B84_03455 [Granulosicoccus sp.]
MNTSVVNPNRLEGTEGFWITSSTGVHSSYVVEYLANDVYVNFTFGGYISTSVDTDSDGIEDILDTDSDNDGIPDSVENQISTQDSDSDGIYDVFDVDITNGSDVDRDGVDDNSSTSLADKDGDGIPNYVDFDSDNDGILDQIEGVTDTDGDGTPNYLDTDSDGDGLSDQYEGSADINYDGTPDYLQTNYGVFDADTDGINNSDEGFYLSPSKALMDATSGGSTPKANLQIGSESAELTFSTVGGNITPTSIGSSSIGFSEHYTNVGTFTIQSSSPLFEVEMLFMSLFREGTTIGNFSLTLEDGTVISNADFTIFDDVIFDGLTVGGFDPITGSSKLLAVKDSSGGIHKIVAPVGATEQTAARIKFEDTYDIYNRNGITSITFELIEGYTSTFDSRFSIMARFASVLDTDLDAIPDYLDEDSDNDSNPDATELMTDADNDGILDWRDPDDDNDGIPSSVEAKLISTGNATGSGIYTDNIAFFQWEDDFSDGTHVGDVQTLTLSDGSVITATVMDIYNNQPKDYVPADAPTLGGSPISGSYSVEQGQLYDFTTSTYNSSIVTFALTAETSAGVAFSPDVYWIDGEVTTGTETLMGVTDGTPWEVFEYLIPNTGLKELQVGQHFLFLNNTLAGLNGYRSDNVSELTVGTVGEPTAESPHAIMFGILRNRDTDADGVEDYLDADSDNDGIPDIVEGANDSDSDGLSDFLDTDSDNNGITDGVEAGISGIDSDGDGIDNSFDVD